MSAKTEVVASKFDLVIWAAIFTFFVVGVVLNFHFAYVALSIRIAAWIVAFILLGLAALQTYHGRTFFNFTKDVRMELRKVVWPSRQQIIQTTGLVIVAVIIFALILWAIDSSLLYAVNRLTG
jgi:preprotein translocase subunit SecE